jgi:hypothetical protein
LYSMMRGEERRDFPSNWGNANATGWGAGPRDEAKPNVLSSLLKSLTNHSASMMSVGLMTDARSRSTKGNESQNVGITIHRPSIPKEKILLLLATLIIPTNIPLL